MNIRRYLWCCRPSRGFMHGLIACGLGLFCAVGLAETYTLTVKVTVVEKTCDINNNQPITVDFGEMVIKNIDGAAYETDIPYTLQCEDAASNPALRFMFGTTGASFNANLLKTSENNLGLRLKQNGNNWNLNNWLNFTYNTVPTLTAVPVPNGTGGIDAGDFTASGTLSVEYR